jgi:hypothetical protein
MMTKSASETTLKTSSTPNGIDNIDQIREALQSSPAAPSSARHGAEEEESEEAESLDSLRARVAAERAQQKAEDQAHLDAALATMDALQTTEVAEDTLLEELVLLGNVDVEFNSSNLSWMLKVLQRSHNGLRFTDFMTGDLRVWALGTLCNWTEEDARPVVNIYMRTARLDADWTIPELFHAVDLLPRYTDMVRLTLHYQKRFALYEQWAEVARVEGEAQARAAVLPNHPSCVADMMAEVAGWQAAGAVMAAAKPPAGTAKPPPLALKVPEFKEITDPGALAPSLLEPSEAEELAKKTFMDNTGRPGMAEVAGWHARDAVLLHGMSAAEAVQSAIKHLSMWTWATPEAKAKRAIPAPIYFPSPVDLGGAYGAGGEAEPVEGEPATPTLLDTWEEGPQPEFEVIRVTAEDLELKERNQARGAARAAGH